MMLLRNFYNVMALLFTGGEFNASTYGDGSLAVKSLNGSIKTSMNNIYAAPNNYIGCIFPTAGPSYCASHIRFGTSDTPVSFEDYTLENYKSIQNKQYMYEGIAYDSATKTYSNTVRVTMYNNTGSDLTVKEIGMVGEYDSFLICREVLSEPITIPAGATVTYRHKFEFQFPTV